MSNVSHVRTFTNVGLKNLTNIVHPCAQQNSDGIGTIKNVDIATASKCCGFAQFCTITRGNLRCQLYTQI